MVATSFVVATLLAQCFSRVDVATMVSRCDLFVFPFYCILSHDLSFRLQPPFSCHHFSSESGLLFLVALHVATSFLGCNHIYVSAASTQVVTSFFWLRPRSWSSVFTCSELLNCDLNNWSRLLWIVLAFKLIITSILNCNQFPHSTLYSRS